MDAQVFASDGQFASGRDLPKAQTRRNGLLFWIPAVTLAVFGTLLLYREALAFPFLFDDMIHLRWLDWHSLPTIWTTAEGLGYYRPLTMSVWKIGYLLQGHYDTAVFHSLNLILHALNTILAGWIAWRAFPGRGRPAYTLLAMALFLTFPFSYQAVPSSSSLSKPLIATLTLTSVLLYWEARRRGSRLLLALSLLVGLSAPFAYETGVMVPIAIIVVELLGYSRKEFHRLSWFPVLYMILIWGVALPIIILMEPETGASLSLPSVLSWWQNGVFFVEGLFFPITPLATPLERLLGIDPYLLLTLLELLIFAALIAFYRWARQLGLFLYALSWFLVGVLPLWLMLDFSYVITSPRLLYMGAVGSVLLWAGVPILLWTRLPRLWWPKFLAIAIVVGLLGFNTVYVRHKMALARTVAAPLWQAAQAAQDAAQQVQEADQPVSLLYLNLPVWIAPKEATYRVGTEGLTFIPEYVRVQDFVYVTTGLEPTVRAFMFDAAKQDWEAYIGYGGDGLDWEDLTTEIRQASSVYLTAYSPTGLHFLEAGSLLAPGDTVADPEAALATFDGQIALLDYQLVPADEGLVVDLWWQGLQVPDSDITLFAHLIDANGQLIAQADGYPMLGLSPPMRWLPGDRVHDIRYFTLPDTVAREQVTLLVGWYDPSTGERLSAFDQHGQPVPNNAVPLVP
ncbi:MAG: hypothetical protein PVI80_21865 [Anaerolineae bacterium]|jgi:hypothetical protein